MCEVNLSAATLGCEWTKTSLRSVQLSLQAETSRLVQCLDLIRVNNTDSQRLCSRALLLRDQHKLLLSLLRRFQMQAKRLKQLCHWDEGQLLSSDDDCSLQPVTDETLPADAAVSHCMSSRPAVSADCVVSSGCGLGEGLVQSAELQWSRSHQPSAVAACRVVTTQAPVTARPHTIITLPATNSLPASPPVTGLLSVTGAVAPHCSRSVSDSPAAKRMRLPPPSPSLLSLSSASPPMSPPLLPPRRLPAPASNLPTSQTKNITDRSILAAPAYSVGVTAVSRHSDAPHKSQSSQNCQSKTKDQRACFSLRQLIAGDIIQPGHNVLSVQNSVLLFNTSANIHRRLTVLTTMGIKIAPWLVLQ